MINIVQNFGYKSNLQEVYIPQRSRLYNLQPIGSGTQLVESLISYLTRLAESHCLLPGVLISREIAPALNTTFVKNVGARGLNALFKHAQALNGTGSMARDFAQTLETLTLRNDLSSLTLVNWTEVIPAKSLFRTYKAWCPSCYQNWLISGQIIYEPLQWVIEAVKFCSRHQQPLHHKCPCCEHKIPILTWRSRPGYCSNCGKWLGSSQSTGVVDSTNLSVDELAKQIWLIDAIGELLAHTPYLLSPVSKKSVAQSLRTSVDIVTDGNVAAFARLLGIPKNTFWGWYTGKNLPLLEHLLKICRFLGVSIVDFVTQETLDISSFQRNNQIIFTEQQKSRKPPTLLDSQHIQDTLLAVLESYDEPPPTMQEVANYSNYDRRTIFRHFPDLSRAISAKFRKYKKTLHLQKLEQSCNEVQQIALQLHSQGIYPSEAFVAGLMTMPGYLRYKAVRGTLQEVQFEIRKQAKIKIPD
jgi:transcriptional regulator with XRE-family HTH domain